MLALALIERDSAQDGAKSPFDRLRGVLRSSAPKLRTTAWQRPCRRAVRVSAPIVIVRLSANVTHQRARRLTTVGKGLPIAPVGS